MKDQIEKQAIEEMAKVIERTEQIARDAHCGLPSPTMYAKDLYWHSYRKQEWISVEDRVPEETCKCLIVDNHGIVFLSSYSGRYRAFNAIDEDEGDNWKMDNVTHWMPLPEPPKMKGGAE
jgi:hypothetical protein